MFEFLGLGLFALLLVIVGIFAAIIVSGFFLWIALKLVGEDRGILEAGIANIVAGVCAGLISMVLAFLPPLIVLYPVVVFLIYTYILKVMLGISYVKAIAVAVISEIVFWITMVLLTMLMGVSITPLLIKSGVGGFYRGAHRTPF